MKETERDAEERRFQLLADRAVEGDLGDDEALELAALLRKHPGWRERLRRELVLWELWSQASAVERGAEAFMASWRTRLGAETNGAAFAREWRARAEGEGARSSNETVDTKARTGGSGPEDEERGRVLAWFSGDRRRWLSALGGIAALAAVVLAGTWLALPNRADAVQRVRGEAVCRKCILGEPHQHTAALRVCDEKGVEHVCYLSPDNAVPHAYGNFCGGPVPVVVTGVVRREGGRETIEVRRVEPAVPSDDPKKAPREFPEKPKS